MSLTWPWALTGLLAFPLLLGVRWWTRRRRRREPVRVPSLILIRAALPGRSAWRRRIPLWLFAGGLVVLAAGAARPQASVLVPSDSSTIMLTMDVSASMCSSDVTPNRLSAAQDAARGFVKAQADGAKVGLVSFSGTAVLLVRPTADRKALLTAIDGLRTGRGTAIGLGILTAIDAIAEINPHVAPTGVDLPYDPAAPAGVYEPDSIVVLTDGANTQGVDPVIAAQQAAARHLRVYTIGFGTTQPAPFVCTPDQIASGSNFVPRPGGGFGGGFGGRRSQDLDEGALTKVADISGGRYFQAKDAAQLKGVLGDLPSVIVLQHRKVELTVWLALAGALLVAVALGLAQWWSRPPVRPSPG